MNPRYRGARIMTRKRQRLQIPTECSHILSLQMSPPTVRQLNSIEAARVQCGDQILRFQWTPSPLAQSNEEYFRTCSDAEEKLRPNRPDSAEW